MHTRRYWGRLFALMLSAIFFSAPLVCAKDQALVVGIERYKDETGFSKLDYSEDDAEQLAQLLRRINFRVMLLTGDQAYKQRLVYSIGDVCRKANNSASTLIIFFAGHGVSFPLKGKSNEDQQTCFCPIDVERLNGDVPFGNVINIDEDVVSQMKDCAAGCKYLFVDACRNDPNRRFQDRFKIPAKLKSTPSGVNVIFSCADGQFSKESLDLKHGVFSYYLLRGLNGMAVSERAQEVTISKLHGYLSDKVPGFVRKTFGADQVQSPRLIRGDAESSDDVVVKLIPPGNAKTIICAPATRDSVPAEFPQDITVFNRYSRHTGEVFNDVTFTGTFVGVNFSDAVFFNCRFVNCEFRGGTKVDEATFTYCNFERANFKNIHTKWVRFDGRRPSSPPWSDDQTPFDIDDD